MKGVIYIYIYMYTQTERESVCVLSPQHILQFH